MQLSLNEPTNEWGVDLETIDFEYLINNRITRDQTCPSSIPRELSKLLYKDICFKSAFGIVLPEYNPIENLCALVNTVLRAVEIDFVLRPQDVQVNYFPKYNTVRSYLQQESLFGQVVDEELVKTTTGDAELITDEVIALTEMQTTINVGMWNRILSNHSVAHSTSPGKGYSIWLFTPEFKDEFRNTPITVSGYHTSTIKFIDGQVVRSELIDRSNVAGNIITVDLFHPLLYKISKELALWAHFILTGENPGKNIYMDKILAAMAKLDKRDKEVVYMLVNTKQEFGEEMRLMGVEQGIEQGIEKGKLEERIESIVKMLKWGLPKETLLEEYTMAQIAAAEQLLG